VRLLGDWQLRCRDDGGVAASPEAIAENLQVRSPKIFRCDRRKSSGAIAKFFSLVVGGLDWQLRCRDDGGVAASPEVAALGIGHWACQWEVEFG